ncbi:MAG: hypothetical protein NTY08_01885 [Proteobacteria bacterium]|nr:hypothetical protein [Pseudomonadota bacterium]
MNLLNKQKVVFMAAFVALGVAVPQSYAAPQTPAAAESAPTPQRPALPLRVIDKNQFCTRLSQAFTNFATANGLDRVHTALLSTGATAEVVQEFRAGRATDYLKVAAIRNIARLPAVDKDEGYLALSGLIGEAMGVGNNVTLALSTGELRYIPSAQRGVDMVVVARNGATLTPPRAQKVIEIAKGSQIRIHILWVGENESAQDVEEARALAWVAANTGGAFANLGGSQNDNPCVGKSL